MDALEALQQRVSCPVLHEPGPTQDQLDNLFRAALRSPDHGAMRPWRFLLIEGDAAREKLGELYLKGALDADPDLAVEKQEKMRKAPFRAPTMVVVIASTREHPKVPVSEQLISAGCAAQNMLVAAHAQGVGAMWRTGAMAYNTVVKEGLGLAAGEEIVGYLYLGTAAKLRRTPVLEPADFVTSWGE